MKHMLIIILCAICLFSCKNDKSKQEPKTSPEASQDSMTLQAPKGSYVYNDVKDLDNAYAQLKSIFENNRSIGIVAEIDHSENAKKANIKLSPTKAIFFGNPHLGTPLMQVNPLTGLDLPQKIIFLQSNDGENQMMYNAVDYLNQRYGLDNHQNLATIANTLKTLVEKTSGSSSFEHIPFEVAKHQGIITKKSHFNFETTIDKLLTIVNNQKNLKLIATLDHQANAQSVGLELSPAYLVVFGNPKLGSPLMKTQQSIALDLPQKMLVWEDENGEVFVSYNDIYFLKNRHLLQGQDDVLEKISDALDKISSNVTE